jgi:3',5'-cyclic AMP phosphodiesterase CpdA
VIVPGNHDVPVYNLVLRTFAPWKRFMAAFNRPVDSQIQCGDVWICGQNSARRAGLSLDWSLGRLSRGQVSQACQLARRAPVQSLKVFALHHPMLAQGRGAAAAVIGGAAQIKQSLSAAGYDLILHGHGHLSRKAIDPDGSPGLLISAAGSATSRRLRGEAQSFDLLHWNDPDLVIETWQLDGSAFQPLPTRTWRRGADGWQSLETPK